MDFLPYNYIIIITKRGEMINVRECVCNRFKAPVNEIVYSDLQIVSVCE